MNKFIGRFTIIILLNLFLSAFVIAQENVFTVIALKGKVSLKAANAGDWKILNVGDKLNSGDKVKLAAKDYLGIAHVKGKTMELKTEGTYDVNELSAKIKKESGTLTKNFTKYLVSEMVVSGNKSKNMTMLGAVVRSLANNIKLTVPLKNNLLNPIINASWTNLGSGKKYVFRLINPSGKTIYMDMISDTSFTLDLNSFNLQKDLTYKWFIFGADNSTIVSDTASFIWLSENKYKPISDSLAQLKADFEDEEALLNQLIIASFFEQNKLYDEAIKVYEKIIQQAPDIDMFKQRYINFLLNSGMTAKAQQLINQG